VVETFAPLVAAIRLADAGEISEAVRIYQANVPDRRLNEWFDLHAQWTYRWRRRARGVSEPVAVPKEEKAPKLGASDGRLSREVYARDSYRCRYCGLRLLALPAFKRFEAAVGPDVFRITGARRNRDYAGPCLVFRPVADHVDPWGRGGTTDLANLVTACWPCNFGKMEYTVEELGMNDPRDRPPVADGWDGLRMAGS
jgi:5-methylcytosine-specific restriction endonuclease McrA